MMIAARIIMMKSTVVKFHLSISKYESSSSVPVTRIERKFSKMYLIANYITRREIINLRILMQAFLMNENLVK